MGEAVRVEPPFVEGKHVGVIQVLEVPLVPVVEADEPVHGGEIEHPPLFAPLEEETEGQ